MKKQSLNMRCLSALVAVSILLLSGCNLGGFLKRAQIGFAEQAGAYAFNVLVDLIEDMGAQAGDLGLPGQGGTPDPEGKWAD